MGKRIKIDELRDLLERANARETVFIEKFQDCANSQVRQEVMISQARCEIYTAIIQALQGDPVMLRLHAGN